MAMALMSNKEAFAISIIERFLDQRPMNPNGGRCEDESFVNRCDLSQAVVGLQLRQLAEMRGAATGHTVLHQLVAINHRVVTHDMERYHYQVMNCITSRRHKNRRGDISYYDLLNVADDEGFTAIHYAATEGYTAILRCMLSYLPTQEHYDILRVIDNEGLTSVHHAAMMGSTEALYYLLGLLTFQQNYEIVNMRDNEEKTVIHHAAMYCPVDMMEYILYIISPTPIREQMRREELLNFDHILSRVDSRRNDGGGEADLQVEDFTQVVDEVIEILEAADLERVMRERADVLRADLKTVMPERAIGKDDQDRVINEKAILQCAIDETANLERATLKRENMVNLLMSYGQILNN